MAWRNRRWGSVEEFNRVQKKWAIAGLIIWVISGGVLLYLASMFSGQKELALEMIRQDPELVETLGEPLETGWFVTGNINSNLNGTCAIVSVPVYGSKTSGDLRMASVGRQDGWLVVYMVLETKAQLRFSRSLPDSQKYDRFLDPCNK